MTGKSKKNFLKIIKLIDSYIFRIYLSYSFIGNSECSKLKCSNSEMEALIRYDLIFQDTPAIDFTDETYKNNIDDVLFRFRRDMAPKNCSEKAQEWYNIS